MNEIIHNPYHVNWKLYGWGIVASILGIIIGEYSVSLSGVTVIANTIKNISLGCLSSFIVALLIEISSVNDMNRKANSIYDSVFSELKFCISYYIECWARFCKVGYPEKNYDDEKHTWAKWYECVKLNYYACDEARQRELVDYFTAQLMYACNNADKAIQRIMSQYYMLELNNVLNDDLKRIIEDFKFEYSAALSSLNIGFSSRDMWDDFDAFNNDIFRYISNWSDIRFYNTIEFSPFSYISGKEENIRALIRSKLNEEANRIRWNRYSKYNN